MNYAILTYGTPSEAVAELDRSEPTANELRAALMNALMRIDALEKARDRHRGRLASLEKQLDA